MENKWIAPVMVLVLLVGGGSFFGGMQYQKTKTPVSAAGRFAPGMGAAGRFGNGQGRNGGGFTNGQVVSKDANSLTIKLRDGGSKLIYIATSTNIGKMAEGSMSDVAVGTEVMVGGTANQDGSVTANTVQIRPAGQVLPIRPSGEGVNP